MFKIKKHLIVAIGATYKEIQQRLDIVAESAIVTEYYGSRVIGYHFKTSEGKAFTWYNGFWSQTGIERDKKQETTSVLARGNTLIQYKDIPMRNRPIIDGSSLWY